MATNWRDDRSTGDTLRARLPNPKGVRTLLGLGLLLLLIAVLSKASYWLVDWLWMEEVGYSPLFLRLLWIRLLLFGICAIFVFLYLWVNLRIAIRQQPVTLVEVQSRGPDVYELNTTPRGLGLLIILVSLALALMFGLAFSSLWDTFLTYFWGGSFNRTDPLFGRDIGFYLFRLPFYQAVRGAITVLAFLTLPIVFLGYVFTGQVRFNPGYVPGRRIVVHLSILVVIFLAAWGSGYYFNIFELLYEKRGAVYGAGYTDYHVVRLGLWAMMGATLLLACLVLANIRRIRLGATLVGVAGYLALMAVVLHLVPAAFQSYVVQPNELSLERAFLEHNIALTRQAYQLDRVEERTISGANDATMQVVSQNQETLKNIRLWDWRPTLQAFRQTQEMRLYYRFYQVDVDRYRFPGEGYRQVMLSARELSEQTLQQARTWVNQYLEFTHGYGLAMCYVSETTESGLPRLVVKDLPPQSPVLPVSQPAIYYGESMPGYRIVRTGVEEFDYPRGDKNVYSIYKGTGGIPIGSFWKRLLFAWHLFDSNILISSYMKPESRLQLHRTVRDRVARIIPFLSLDPDPYLVVSEGRLFWLQDAYTTSSRYPYSDPYSSRVNYIRNSVKAVVDAYNGSVSFYVSDPEDPLLLAYQRAFPGTFKPLSKLPPDLKAHLRYPEDIFRIQADRLMTYHMTDPRVFYNKEDLWSLPMHKYAGKPAGMEPYYTLIRLPNEQQLQFLLMLPLTPFKKENMVAWLAAGCDFPQYGRLNVYRLPKDRVIYGPMQIEAMIDQEPTISQQLSLWDQRGSRVIRGNLLVIPLENSFLYVEPVYLIAEQVNIPQLIRVIVVYGNRVVMQPSLSEAVRAVFGNLPMPAAAQAPARVSDDNLARARKEFERAEEALRRGQWSEFGKAMEALKKLLEK